LKDEPAAIDELYAFRRALVQRHSHSPRSDCCSVRCTYDDKYDLRFLNALIAHHEMGLDMTSEKSASKSSRTEVLNNADAVDTFLKNTLQIFTGLENAVVQHIVHYEKEYNYNNRYALC
jgi:uncharacterized protein (DUF305 family)